MREGRQPLDIGLSLWIDARSVFDAVKNTRLHQPAEKSLGGHVAWLREMIQHRVLTSVCWCDTRDMTADAMTKGTIPRDLLTAAMSGLDTPQWPVLMCDSTGLLEGECP